MWAKVMVIRVPGSYKHRTREFSQGSYITIAGNNLLRKQQPSVYRHDITN